MVKAANGITLEVPAGVVAHETAATITDVGDGKYDIHIAGDWTGKVAVTMPLAGHDDAVAHQVGGSWAMEGTDYAQSTVWVTSPSLFSTIRDAAIKLVCKAFGNTVLPCLLGKGIQFVDKQLALWIAKVTGNSCAATVIATIIGGGFPGNRFVKSGEFALRLLFSEQCAGMAGESQDYINAHIDWNGDGIPDAQQQQPAPSQAAPAPAPAPAPQPAPAPAPAPQPAPAVPAPAPAPPVAVPPAPPAPAPMKAWVTRDGDTITYHWQSMPPGMWPQVDRFRCWRYTQQTHPGGWATDGCGEKGGFAGFPTGDGSVSFTYPGATDSFSIEPWKFGPWLSPGGVWQQ